MKNIERPIKLVKPDLFGDAPEDVIKESLLQGHDGNVILMINVSNRYLHDDRENLIQSFKKICGKKLRIFRYHETPWEECGEGPVWDWKPWSNKIQGKYLMIVVDCVSNKKYGVQTLQWKPWIDKIEQRKHKCKVRVLSYLPVEMYEGSGIDVVEWREKPSTHNLTWDNFKNITQEAKKLYVLGSIAPVFDPLLMRLLRMSIMPEIGVWAEWELTYPMLWKNVGYDGAVMRDADKVKSIESLKTTYSDLIPLVVEIMDKRSNTLPPGLRNEEKLIAGIILNDKDRVNEALDTLISWNTADNHARLSRYLDRVLPTIIEDIEMYPQAKVLKGIASF